MAPDMEKEKIIFIYVIVSRSMGSKVLHAARKHGLPGGTIILGRGTINKPFLEALALNDVRKEIVLLATAESAGKAFLNKLSEEFKFHKPNHGIAFIMDVEYVYGSKSLGGNCINNVGDEETAMYQSVNIIVDRGRVRRLSKRQPRRALRVRRSSAREGPASMKPTNYSIWK
jgi:hypothetical protein